MKEYEMNKHTKPRTMIEHGTACPKCASNKTCIRWHYSHLVFKGITYCKGFMGEIDCRACGYIAYTSPRNDYYDAYEDMGDVIIADQAAKLKQEKIELEHIA